jgi:hypothetical protein
VAGPCRFLLFEVALCWAVRFGSSSHPSRSRDAPGVRGRPRGSGVVRAFDPTDSPRTAFLGAPLRMYVRFAPSSHDYPAIPATSMQIGGGAGGVGGRLLGAWECHPADRVDMGSRSSWLARRCDCSFCPWFPGLFAWFRVHGMVVTAVVVGWQRLGSSWLSLLLPTGRWNFPSFNVRIPEFLVC